MNLEQSIKNLQDYNIKKLDPELQKFIIDIVKCNEVNNHCLDEMIKKVNTNFNIMNYLPEIWLSALTLFCIFKNI